MANPFVHVELNTTDVDRAKKFYGQLFHWQLEDVPMEQMTYTMIKVGSGTGGGMMKQLMPQRAVGLASLRGGRRHQGLDPASQDAGRGRS
jgi:predicted enzyme related to lactoylglutathione lyase